MTEREDWNIRFAELLLQRIEMSYQSAIEIAESMDDDFNSGLQPEESVDGWEEDQLG